MSQAPAARWSWWVALRAVVWSALFAGTVAIYIPSQYFGVTLAHVRLASLSGAAGTIAVIAGGALALTCIMEFVTRGRGTPAPMDPPRELVARGPYGVVRNPMYVGMLLVLLGELCWDFSRGFTTYIAAWFTLMNLLVVLYEEPALRRKFGEPYARYTREVGRWWPKRSPRDPDHDATGHRGG